MKRHYHVFVSMPGYLPDNETEVHRTRKDAEAAAKWHADGYRDVIYETNRENAANGNYADMWRITGSARTGCYVVDRGEFALPIYITIDPCTDATCEIEEN